MNKPEGNGAVLHFAAEWLPASQVFVYDLIRNLSRRAVVVAGTPLENTGRFPLSDVHSLTTLYRLVRIRRLRPSAVTAALGFLVRRRGVVLVHVHHGYQVEFVLQTVRRHRLPLVLSLHGHDLTGYLEERPDAYQFAREEVRAVVVPSQFLAGLAVEQGFERSAIRVLPSGIDTSFFSPSPFPDGPPVALFVGRFVEKKGIDVIARAWPEVQSRIPEARLRLLGFGPQEDLARSIRGNVSVELNPTPHQVRQAMRDSHAVLSPSHTAPDDSLESLLIVNLEAQASARPVVTTRHGGIPEYVRDGETALLVPEGDSDELGRALVEVLSDDGLARRLGSAGPAWAANFDVRKAATRMDALYDELLDEGSSTPLSEPGMGRSTCAGTPDAK